MNTMSLLYIHNTGTEQKPPWVLSWGKNCAIIPTTHAYFDAQLKRRRLNPSNPLHRRKEITSAARATYTHTTRTRTNLAGALHVAQGREAHVVERVVRYVMLVEVDPAVLKGPERQGVVLRICSHHDDIRREGAGSTAHQVLR